MYETATGDLAFGDVFAADWFFSAYLKRDAVPLAEFTPSKPKVARAWQPANPSEHRDYLFAHGRQRQAILLADDCEAESIVKRRASGGRLVFAAIERLPPGPTAREETLATNAFRHFPLPPADGFTGGVVHFQELFAVAVDGVIAPDGADPRVARLGSDMRLALEMRWTAYATRRGPLTHADNGEKLARVLSGEGDTEKLRALRERELHPEEGHLTAGREVARTLGFAWEIEGGALNDVADVLEQGDALDAPRERLIELFKHLGSSAQRSAALLEATRSSGGSDS